MAESSRLLSVTSMRPCSEESEVTFFLFDLRDGSLGVLKRTSTFVFMVECESCTRNASSFGTAKHFWLLVVIDVYHQTCLILVVSVVCLDLKAYQGQ